MVDKAQLRSFRTRLAQGDKDLAPTDPEYVPNLHGSDEEDVIARLFDDVMTRSGSREIFYFSGQRGTGKSTELRRFETLVNGEGAQAIRFDSLDYISDTDLVSVESLLLLVTAGLADWALANYRENFLKASTWERFTHFLQTELQITDVSAYGVKAKLKEQQATVIEKVRKLAEPRQWTKIVAAFAGEIVEFIRTATKRDKVVVIVDSLERLRGVSEADQKEMFTHVVTAFAGEFDRLRIPGASAVYSVPPYLALLADVRNYVSCYSLASVRVFEMPQASGHRRTRKAGLQVMQRLIDKRYAPWREVLSSEALDKLAEWSGGDLRHFMQRLVSGVVGQAQFALDRLPLQPDDTILNGVREENRGETERLTVRSEWPLLKSIATSHNAIAEDRGESLRAMARLFETRVILNYRNGQEWFDVHPLLWPLIDDFDPGAATA